MVANIGLSIVIPAIDMSQTFMCIDDFGPYIYCYSSADYDQIINMDIIKLIAGVKCVVFSMIYVRLVIKRMRLKNFSGTRYVYANPNFQQSQIYQQPQHQRIYY